MPERWSRHLGYAVVALLGFALLGVILKAPPQAGGVAVPLQTPGTNYMPLLMRSEPSPTPTATSTSTSTPTPTATSTATPTATSTSTPSPTPSCGEIIENGDFEQGRVIWTEDSSGQYPIITKDWADPHQGEWVAWLDGYFLADDRIYQRIHIPDGAQDSSTLEFYLYVDLGGLDPSPGDTLWLQFFDSSWNPASDPTFIADGSAPMGWTYNLVTLPGISGFAGEDMYIQFRGTTDDEDGITSFLLDVVSLKIVCGSTAQPQPGTPWISIERP
jgi:hypothetical protein